MSRDFPEMRDDCEFRSGGCVCPGWEWPLQRRSRRCPAELRRLLSAAGASLPWRIVSDVVFASTGMASRTQIRMVGAVATLMHADEWARIAAGRDRV